MTFCSNYLSELQLKILVKQQKQVQIWPSCEILQFKKYFTNNGALCFKIFILPFSLSAFLMLFVIFSNKYTTDDITSLGANECLWKNKT